jgi:hypothetical protein
MDGPMSDASVFISHSSADKGFATAVVEAMKVSDLAPWIDKERILVGTDILEELGNGRSSMDLFVLIISEMAIKSGWVQKEISYAAYREITEKKALILPFIIDQTKVADLPWHIRTRNVATIPPDAEGVRHILESVRHSLDQREDAKPFSKPGFRPISEVEALIKGMKLGDWDTAEDKALEVLQRTDARGGNVLVGELLTYRDAGEQETVMHALAIVEMCAAIAPSTIGRLEIVELAAHKDFSVRSTAASICMELARVAPDRVPIDVLLRLSRHDEDWYVQAPANAALKTLARQIPAVMRVFLNRLDSDNRDEREHAASQLFDISTKEPEILDPETLGKVLHKLTKRHDKNAREIVARILTNLQGHERQSKYKYGL